MSGNETEERTQGANFHRSALVSSFKPADAVFLTDRKHLPVQPFQFISLSDIMHEQEDFDPTGKALLLCLLKAQHSNHAKEQTLLPFRTVGASKRYSAVQSSYNRMFTFGDPTLPSHCAVLFEVKKASDGMTTEKSLWRKALYQRENVSVGHWFAIFEPSVVNRKTTIGECLKIETQWSLYPLRDSPPLQEYFRVPTEPNRIVSFYLPHTKITINRSVPIDSCCGGNFCDRQETKASHCACYNQNNTNGLVMWHDIAWSYHNQALKATFSSLKFSDLAFQSNAIRNGIYSQEDMDTDLIHRIRQSFQGLTEFINAKNGWTLTGWAMLPEAREDQGYNSHINYHLISITPTKPQDYEAYKNKEDNKLVPTRTRTN